MTNKTAADIKNKIIHLSPGVGICLLIAFPSWLLGRAFPIIGGAVISIIIGILIANLFPVILKGQKVNTADGIRYTSRKLLQYSIVLLGFEMNLFNVIKVGGQSLAVLIFTMVAAFLTAFLMGKALKLSGDTTALIGVGTAVCGGSAIAATASVIDAKDDDVVRSISTIFLFNVAAVFIFPPLGRLLGMGDADFGMWAGTAINDTSSVVAAGTAWSNAVGNNAALQIATIVKLTRTLTIIPITLFFAIYTAQKHKRSGIGNFNLAKVFPWFVIFFVAAAMLGTFASIPQGTAKALVTVGKFIITMAMAAIGLNTNIKSLLKNGLKPILLGLCCWIAVASVSILIQGFGKF